jgi:AcrR family transcriptional regulator
MNTNSITSLILQAEQDGLVRRTFRRLDPERQTAVVDAILAEAAESGPDQLRVQAVADKAGVAVGSLYQYFPDREKLLDFAILLCTRTWLDTFAIYLPMLAEMPLRDGLQAYVLGGMEMSEMEKGVVRFFGRAAYQGLTGKPGEAVGPIAAVMLDCVRSMLSRAQERGEIRTDLDLDATARSVNAYLIALGDGQLFPYLNRYYCLSDDKMPFERVFESALDLLIRGLAPDRQAETSEQK